jgi:hypothetical protein
MRLGDITDYTEIGDWSYILLAILIIDLIVLFLTKYFPDILGKAINVWYERFGLSAVLSDIFIIAIGFALARYAYKYFQPLSYDGFNLPLFIGLLVGIQLLHDIFFYLFVIKPIPRGHNRMMDVFKDYAASGGGKILVADAAMMVGSAFLAMVLKEAPADITVLVGLFSIYTLPYILETTNKYSLFE